MRSLLCSALLVLSACHTDYGFAPFSTLQPVDDASTDAGQPSDDPTVDRTGPEHVTDRFGVAADLRADIVFYGDTSNSMTEELVTLGDEVRQFVDRLVDHGADWQLMAVTGADGCGVNGVLTADTPDFEQAFADAIVSKPDDETQDEMGLQNIATAMGEADGGCNDGFLRDGAALHVIFLSDENDESPGFDGDADYWRPYVDAIVEAKGDDDVIFSAVAGATPDGCEGADPGYGYAEVVDATGGAFLSICDAWYDDLAILADRTVTQDQFALSRTPELATVTVHVDDAATDAWTYDALTQTITIHDAPPMAGSVVEISYIPAD